MPGVLPGGLPGPLPTLPMCLLPSGPPADNAEKASACHSGMEQADSHLASFAAGGVCLAGVGVVSGLLSEGSEAGEGCLGEAASLLVPLGGGFGSGGTGIDGPSKAAELLCGVWLRSEGVLLLGLSDG